MLVHLNLSPMQKTCLFTDSALYQDDEKILLSIRGQNSALYKDDEFFKTWRFNPILKQTD